MNTITPAELAQWQRGGLAHTLIDVRRAAKRATDGDEIPDGRWLDPAQWLDWKDAVPADQPAVVYCAYGHEISQGLNAALRALGVVARNLEGGIAAWRESGQRVQPLPARVS